MQRIQRLFYETIVRRDGLKKYDLVVVGNYNAARFARNFYRTTNELYDILLVNSQAISQIRDGVHSRFVNPSNIIDGTSISSTDGVGIQQIYPEQNKLILYNGREINYDQLVIAEDLQNNFASIEGLSEALNDKDHPVFTSTHDFNSKITKDAHRFLKYSTGNIVYYIPKIPFNGASDFTSPFSNFETISSNKKQRRYMELKYQIISANPYLIPQYQVDQEYIQKLKEKNIGITTNAQLLKINKQEQQLELLVNNQIQIQNYDALYLQGVESFLPSWLDVFLQNNQVYSDDNTLNHKQYRNVFFFGNTNYNNYQTIQRQIKLATENVHRNFQGQKLVSKTETNQTIFFYEGQYQINRLDQKVNKYLTPVLNHTAIKVGRYFWQTKLQDKLKFLDDLQQQYITNRLYGIDRKDQQKIEVKDLIEQQQVQLKYKLNKKTINDYEILDILQYVNKENKYKDEISQATDIPLKVSDQVRYQDNESQVDEVKKVSKKRKSRSKKPE